MEKDWNNFYTPKVVASQIVDLIPNNYNPQIIVDICAGSGNFLSAALERWNVEALGVDIHPAKEKVSFTMREENALDFDRLKFINKNLKKLIVANPPFGKLEDKIESVCNRHLELQMEALRSNRIETNMIISNMSLLEEGEIFAAILPENIFSSSNLKKFRDLFLSYFELIYNGTSEKYFKGSEVKTRIFIGKYQPNTTEKENDVIEHKVKSTVTAIRGIDNSKLLRNSKVKDYRRYSKVVHFSNDYAHINIDCMIKKDNLDNRRKIQKSDFLISRVGRNSGKIHLAKNAFIGKYASDYFYIIKDGEHLLKEEILSKLEKRLLSKVNGLTAKYLRKSDIMHEIAMIEIESKLCNIHKNK